MRFIFTAATLLALLVLSSGSVLAQSDDWEVEGELSIEDVDEPGIETATESLQNQGKVETYAPLLEIAESGTTPGFGTLTYVKDADPFGDFVLEITATSVGDLDVIYQIGHEIINVTIGGFNVQTTLEVETIDLNGGGVTLTAPENLLTPGVVEDDGLADEQVPLPLFILGTNAVIVGEGTQTYDSGVRPYVGANPTVGMFMTGNFRLSAGDKAILRGRFEIDPDMVSVESRAWGEIKALYRD